MTTEHPILMSPENARAVHLGLKTMTRRVIKPQLKYPQHHVFTYYERPGYAIENGPDYPDDESDERRCPYGVPGHNLWVREACVSVPDIHFFHNRSC